MLRVHFTGEDLGRTRLAAGPDPLWDVLLSLHQLPCRDGGPMFDPWRRQVRATLPAPLRWLGGIAPPRGYSPDFLTPGARDLEAGLERVAATPRDLIRRDIDVLAGQRPLPAQVRALADGAPRAMDRLVDALHRYHDVAIRPFTRQIEPHVRADVAARVRTLQDAGLGEVFTSLHERARWRSPVLELPYPVHQDLRLDGRGLVLVPSFFCWRHPVMLRDVGARPVLVFPIARELAWAALAPRAASAQPLENLLGRTRAAILCTLAAQACSTSELAARAGVSASLASQHAAVLRDAGLITTRRVGRHVVHSTTGAADALLQSAVVAHGGLEVTV